MSDDIAAIRTYFSKLGLKPEIADIYLALHAYGPQPISELARRSGVERTRVYRLIDEIVASGLIEIEMQYKRQIFRAGPLTNLQILISKKEQEVRDLQVELDQLHRNLSHSSMSTPVTRVQAYRGSEGLKQMYWNQTKSKSENLSILYENMQIRTNEAFFERWAKTCNEHGLKFRSVIGDNFLKTQADWYETHANERLQEWEGRYMPESSFHIGHSTVVYDNVTSYYNWKNGEIFGIELYNQEIADAQRQLFEMLWVQSSPLEPKA